MEDLKWYHRYCRKQQILSRKTIMTLKYMRHRTCRAITQFSLLYFVTCSLRYTLNLQEPKHKLQHLAVPYLSVWCLTAMWLRVSPFPYGATFQGDSELFWFLMPLHVSLTQESLPFRMALPISVTQGLSVSARRYTSTWLRVSLVPYGTAYQCDSGPFPFLTW